MKARDGIEAQYGLNDVWPGDEYPDPDPISLSEADKVKWLETQIQKAISSLLLKEPTEEQKIEMRRSFESRN